MRLPTRSLELLGGVLLPLIALAFVAGDRVGVLDRLLGLNEVEAVASRFETSYAHVDRQVGPDEPAWQPLLALINRYTTADLPKGRQPTMLARAVAVASDRLPNSDAEWTAPTTPIMLVYGEASARAVPAQDVLIVGTIGDLRSWPEQRRTDLRFLFQDIFVSVVSLIVAVVVWLRAAADPPASQSPSAPQGPPPSPSLQRASTGHSPVDAAELIIR